MRTMFCGKCRSECFELFGDFDCCADCEIGELRESVEFLENDLRLVQEEMKEFCEVLEDATCSLETIARDAGRDEFMKDLIQIRGYAGSRAGVAREFLTDKGQPLPDPTTDI